MSGDYFSILAFTVALTTGFRWFRQVYAVALPRNRGGFLASMGIGVCLGIAGLVLGSGITGGILSGISIFLGCFFVFAWQISTQAASN